jgi:hypoxanthine phosphoribosyltransferase
MRIEWRTYGRLTTNLLADIENQSLKFNAIFGINEGGLTVASFLTSQLGRQPIGYVKLERAVKGGRVILTNDCAFPETLRPTAPGQPLNILLVDSELKTGGALKKVLPFLRKKYPQAQFYFAVLFARLNPKYWKSGPKTKRAIRYSELLEAREIEHLGLKGITFGGLFGKGRLDPPLGVR